MAFGLSAGSAFLLGTIGSAAIGAVSSNRASKNAANAMRGQSDAAALQAQIAGEQWDRYKEIYDPLERSYVDEASKFDSPEQYARAAGDASATVAQQFGKARERLQRTPGLDTSTPGFASQMVGLDAAQAAADATQQNAARRNVKMDALQLKGNAINLGKGLPGSAGALAGNAATQFGNMASNQYQLAQSQAATAGNVMDRVFNPTSMNWLNNQGRAAFSQTELGQSGFGTGAAYGNQDMGQFL